MLAEGKRMGQMANFELREPLQVGELQFFYVCDATDTDHPISYRLERFSV